MGKFLEEISKFTSGNRLMDWAGGLNGFTCIDNIFGCLLLKCDTGLSLEIKNSEMI